MRLTLVKILPVAMTFCFLSSMALAQQSAPDLVMFNGKIFTSNSSLPYVEALAIRGERIVAVGASKEIVALEGTETRRIDLGGRTVIPGINDAHYHLGFNVDSEDLQIDSNDPSWQEIKSAVSSTVAKVPKGTWITGSFGPTMLDDPEATRAVLDALAPNDPVLLKDLGGYRWLVNTAALRKLGIHEDEPNPEAGEYVRSTQRRQADRRGQGLRRLAVGPPLERVADRTTANGTLARFLC